jgi:general secretion pathway protein D
MRAAGAIALSVLALLAVVLWGAAGLAASEREPRDVTLRFEDAEIGDVVQAVAAATGATYVFDDSLRGPVTVAVAGAVTASEAREILNALLFLKGYGVVPTGEGAYKILKVQDSTTSAPVREPGSEGEASVTTLVRLENASPEKVLSALAPFTASSSSVVVPLPASDAVVLSSSESRVRRMLGLIRALDQAQQRDLIVRRLRYRSASEALQLVEGAFPRDAARPDPEVWAVDSGEALVLRGSPGRLDEVRDFLERIDQPARGHGAIQVLRVLNQDPQRLAELLQGFVASSTPTPTPTPGARPAGAGELTGRDVTVVADPPSRSLVVRADPETQAVVRHVVEQLDLLPPRVTVDLLVLEVEIQGSLELGFDVQENVPLGGGESVASLFSNPSGGGFREPGQEGSDDLVLRVKRAPFEIPVVDGSGQTVELFREQAQIIGRKGEVHSHVLMQPHLRMVSGEEHLLSVGNNIPIAVARADAQSGDPLSNTTDIQRQDVGVELRLRPSLGQAGSVRLQLQLDITDVASSVAGQVSQVGPTIRQRRLDSVVFLNPGEVAVLGVFDEPRTSRSETRVPWLGRIPWLGALFRSSRSEVHKRRLVVTASAEVQRSFDEDLAETIRRRLAFEREQARVARLVPESRTPWALLVSSRSREDDARAIADSLAARGLRAEVVEWEWDGERAFDVYLLDLGGLPEVTREATRLREDGFEAEIVVLPEKQAARRAARSEP